MICIATHGTILFCCIAMQCNHYVMIAVSNHAMQYNAIICIIQRNKLQSTGMSSSLPKRILIQHIVSCCDVKHRNARHCIIFLILFCSVSFHSIMNHSMLSYYVLFCSILFYSILFYFVLYYSILLYLIMFYHILFYYILSYSIILYSILVYTILIQSTVPYCISFY